MDLKPAFTRPALKNLGRRQLIDELEKLQERLRMLESQQVDRRQLEQALRDSETRARVVTDALPILLGYVDAEQRFQDCNELFESWFRRPRSELIGRTLREVLPATYYESIKGQVETALSGRSASGQGDVTLPDGITRHVFRNYIPDLADDGTVRGFYFYVQDFTERRLAEQQLKQAHRELELRVEARTAELERANEELRKEIAERERAEAEVKISREVLAQAVESLTDGFVIYDSDECMVLCNRRYREIYHEVAELLVPGARLEDVAHETARRCAGLESPDAIVAWVADRMRRHRSRCGPSEQRLKDGRWVLLSENALPNGWTVGIRTDISALKERESALRHSEASLSKAQKIANLAHWVYDERRQVLWSYSDELPGLLGVAPEALPRTFEGWLDFVHPDDRQRYAAVACDPQSRSKGYELEYRIVRADGAVRHLYAMAEAEFDAAGRFLRTLGVDQDITERKLAEEKLRNREERLAQTVELAGLGHWVWDAIEDRCIHCSREHARIHGTTVEDYLARSSKLDGDFPFTHPEDREDMRATFKALRAGRGFAKEYRVLTPAGETRHIREIAKPVFDENGRVVREFGTSQDITEIKLAEIQLRQAQKMEAVGQLTGGVAHDFNNLLAVIVGNAELLETSPGDDDDPAQAIIRAASRGAELTQQLLAFSRRQALRPQAVDLGLLVAGMSELLSRTLGETIDVRIASRPRLWAAKADPGQLEHALLNLAINARDAMPGGGRLTIETANVALDDDAVAVEPELKPGEYVMLAVTDTGCGMPQEVATRAFEPFFTTKDVGQGSGLGLSMVYGFVRQTGGHVTIHSEPERGTTVRLYLPRAGFSPIQFNEAPPGEDPGGTGETVLVVEDDSGVRKLVVSMLESLGYRVLAAQNGATALATLEHAPDVDLLVCDVVLPGGMAGPDVARRAARRCPAMKVLFMSGYSENAIYQKDTARAGANLLKKPFRKHELAQRVRAALDGGVLKT